ncbi:hypothetical protein TNCV_14271 [Trichonephila clavipes]|nr:hypothetical protein TNCV_14271 [Trichonephila clavipes]
MTWGEKSEKEIDPPVKSISHVSGVEFQVFLYQRFTLSYVTLSVQMGPMYVKYVEAQISSHGVVWKLGERVSALVSSSSLNQGFKRRGSSPKTLRVAE